MSTVSTKFERFAWSRYPEAFGSRIFNPLRWRPPTGGELALSGPPGRFQPGPVAPADPSPPGFRPVFQGNLPRTPEASPKTTGERFPLDHPKKPSGRRPDALPVLSGEIRIRPVWKGGDQIGSKKFRALKSRDFAC